NTGANLGHANNVTNLTLTPSCGAFVASTDCPTAPSDFRDPGVFTLSALATGSNCGGVTTFTVTGLDAASGKVGFSRGFTLAGGPTPCVISFTFNVNKTATLDADNSRSGVQTAVLAG